MEKDIIEGNKMIAEFMGFKRIESPKVKEVYMRAKHWIIEGHGYFDDEELKYHTSWDWLMPCVEKIETIDQEKEDDGYSVLIQGVLCQISDMNMMGTLISEGFKDKKIDAVWQAVIQFITWYNQNNSNPQSK